MSLFLLCWLAPLAAPTLTPHEGHAHDPAPANTFPGPTIEHVARPDRTTGSGELTFRHVPLPFPEAMAEHLVHAHGGFAHNSEAEGGDGETYFALKGVGLLRLSPDMSRIDVIGGDERFATVNVHNTCLFREHGETYLALPSDEAQQAFLTTLKGDVLRVFPNPYGPEQGAFRVCDLEYVEGLLYAPNGYADNVVFRTNPFRRSPADPGLGTWDDWRFGGSGTEHGKFGTAHGITRVPGTSVFTIADRANARIESFTPSGTYVGGLRLPEGSLPCDVDYHEDLTLVGCLKGPAGSTPAPIYIYRDGNLAAELNVGRDLGLEGFTHIHNAAFRAVHRPDGTRKLYVLVYAWNPGNFALLEQVD